MDLHRFPSAFEQDVAVTATVPDGMEIRGESRSWDGDSPSNWGISLNPQQSGSGKANKNRDLASAI